MKKSEKTLLVTFGALLLVGATFFGVNYLLNPPLSAEQVELAEAGTAYGKAGHSEVKTLFALINDELNSEIDMSDEGMKNLTGSSQGCKVDDKIGGQWVIKGWLLTDTTDFDDLEKFLQENDSTLTREESATGTLTVSNSQAKKVIVEPLTEGKLKVELYSSCQFEA